MARHIVAAADTRTLTAVTERHEKTLITGAAGGLGRYFQRNWPVPGGLISVSRSAASGMLQLDMAEEEAVDKAIAATKPNTVIHCAALADVDRCQREPEAAYLANVQATRFLVNALKRHSPNSKLVYISTDQVYAGPGPSVETAPPKPCNIYGWTKLWGEDIALQLSRTLVLRLNYVGIGTEKKPGLAKWIADSVASGSKVTLFDDVLFNPLHGRQIPGLIHALLEQDICGVLNTGCKDGLSKAAFGLALIRELNLRDDLAKVGRLADVKLDAPRPFDTRTDTSLLDRLSGHRLPSASHVIAELARELHEAA